MDYVFEIVSSIFLPVLFLGFTARLFLFVKELI